MSTRPVRDAGALAARADDMAAAALRELPEALVVAFDPELRVIAHAGRSLLESAGSHAHACKGEPVAAIFPPAVWAELEQLFESALEGETRSRQVAGERRLLVDVGPLAGREGEEVLGGVAVVLDGSARTRAQAENGRVDAFEEVFERAPTGTALLDPQWRWLLVNHALCEITGFTAQELIGRPFEAVVQPAAGPEEAEGRRALLAGELAVLQGERTYLNAAGERLAAIVSVSLVRGEDGSPLHFIAQLQDISERKQLEERLRHLADHDPLTGLRNRRLFDHDLDMQVARSRRYHEVAGLVLLDLDNFKRVNDEHGHGAGDQALRQVARALRARLRGTDLIARLGGDEFAVLLPHVDRSGLAIVALGLSKVVRACSVEVGALVLHPSASVGYTLIDEDCASAGEVFERADRAMYEAKRAGRPAGG